MASSYDSMVNSFYLAYYGRPADPAGLAFWSAQLESADGDFSAIVSAFSTSDEATARFGSDDATARITSIYEQLFDRAPDAAGLSYWLGAIGNGSVTLADAAVQIMQGAQGTDAYLSAVRLQAAESFTAAVAAGGVDYTGLSTIEAAQMLIKATTLQATDADIATMVSETAKLVNIAYANPTVLEALATGTTLSALFDTARGSADPVGLVRTLADVGAAAAGSPDTLESLLRGGGMLKVLTVMPTTATLTDVVDALASGGLPAAVDVVYPTTASTPATASVSFAFGSVTEGTLDTVHDNVTNQAIADVTFSYSGTKLSTIAGFEYSVDGGATWSSAGVTADSTTKTVTIADLQLGYAIYNSPLVHINTRIPEQTTTTVYVRAVDAAGHAISPAAHQDIVFDAYVSAATVALAHDTAGTDLGTTYDNITSNGDYTVTAETGATVEYALVQSSSSNQELTWTTTKPVLQEGENTFYVRVTDAAGNTNETWVDFTLDKTAPAAPTLQLDSDTGSSATDKVTSVAKVAIGGLATEADATAWEYQVDGGAWTTGAHSDGSGAAVLDLTGLLDGTHSVTVRQYDAAGNVSETGSLDFTLATAAPTTLLSFSSIEGATPGTQPGATTSLATPDVTFGYDTLAQGDHVEWTTDGVTWHTDGVAVDTAAHTVTVADVDLSLADATLQVRVVDAAGNAGAALGVPIDSLANDLPAEPVASTATTAAVDMTNSEGLVYLNSFPNSIAYDEASPTHNGFANADTLVLQDLHTGTATATATDYTDGSAFAALDGVVRLDSVPTLGFYEMSWSDDTFLTTDSSGAGYMAAGSVMFVGGKAGQTTEAGFGIDTLVSVSGSATYSGVEGANTAFVDTGLSEATIVTGAGNDLVSDNGGTLTIVHDSLATGYHTVILGFDTGNDTIQLDGAAASAVDRSGNAAIDWAVGTTITAATEAVELSNTGAITASNNSYDLTLLAGRLNSAVNVGAIAAGDSLLILANNGDNGALIYYTNTDGNGTIDAADLTIVDMFAGGTIHAADIQVVGSNLGIPGGD